MVDAEDDDSKAFLSREKPIMISNATTFTVVVERQRLRATKKDTFESYFEQPTMITTELDTRLYTIEAFLQESSNSTLPDVSSKDHLLSRQEKSKLTEWNTTYSLYFTRVLNRSSLRRCIHGGDGLPMTAQITYQSEEKVDLEGGTRIGRSRCQYARPSRGLLLRRKDPAGFPSHKSVDCNGTCHPSMHAASFLLTSDKLYSRKTNRRNMIVLYYISYFMRGRRCSLAQTAGSVSFMSLPLDLRG